jgi:Fe2+ or Zn2+ uptake regulation protein
MANNDSNSASIESWLKERGYSTEERQKILSKLAQHDHETMSDAIFDSIGTSDKTLDQMIAAMLRD